MINKRIVVLGKVQGVFFRASTAESAKAFGINGTVRNVDDGSVEIEAEGEAEAMDNFIEWCHKGPSGAVVNEVCIFDGVVKGFPNFKIIR